jgi:hypothetical protein
MLLEFSDSLIQFGIFRIVSMHRSLLRELRPISFRIRLPEVQLPDSPFSASMREFPA